MSRNIFSKSAAAFFDLLKNWQTSTSVAAVLSSGVVGFGLDASINCDFVQRRIVKYRLDQSRTKNPAVVVQGYIDRDADAKHLASSINWTLNADNKLHLAGNPRGYGKSVVVRLMGYLRNVNTNQAPEFYRLKQGGVLEAPCGDALTVMATQESLNRLFGTLFWNPFGSWSIAARNTWADRKSLVLEVAESLAAEQRPVMLIIDDFSHLVSKAINSPGSDWAFSASGFIRELYDMNQKMIVLAVCSSATTYKDLDLVNGHVQERSKPYFINRITDTIALHQFVKYHDPMISQESENAFVVACGGHLEKYKQYLSAGQKDYTLSLKSIRSDQIDQVHSSLGLGTSASVDPVISLRRYQLLESIATDSKISSTSVNRDDLRLFLRDRIVGLDWNLNLWLTFPPEILKDALITQPMSKALTQSQPQTKSERSWFSFFFF